MQRCSIICHLRIQLLQTEADLQNISGKTMVKWMDFLFRWKLVWLHRSKHSSWWLWYLCRQKALYGSCSRICAKKRQQHDHTKPTHTTCCRVKKKRWDGRHCEMSIKVSWITWRRTIPGYEKGKLYWMLWMLWILHLKNTEAQLAE